MSSLLSSAKLAASRRRENSLAPWGEPGGCHYWTVLATHPVHPYECCRTLFKRMRDLDFQENRVTFEPVKTDSLGRLDCLAGYSFTPTHILLLHPFTA